VDFRRLFLFFLACSFAFGAPSFETLTTHPRSLAKDYYIYRYLTESEPKPKEAWALLGQVQRMSHKLLFAFQDKVDEPGFNKVLTCMRMNATAFMRASTDCQAIRMSPSFALTLPQSEREKVAQTLTKAYPDHFPWLPLLTAENMHDAMLKDGAPHFLYLYTSVGQSFRESALNRPLSKASLKAFSQEKQFELFVKKVVIERVHEHVTHSLLLLSPSRDVSSTSAFFLGLNALTFDNPTLADKWFETSFDLAYYRSHKDRALFWRHLATQSKQPLEKLANSQDLNLYSVSAKELLGLPPFETHLPKVEGEKLASYSITDPFTWRFTLQHINTLQGEALTQLGERFANQKTLPHHAFIKEKASRYTENYFIVPYAHLLKETENERKALMLAIARQESRFIPAAISTSYALGMMQFMPFLARDIAKKEGLDEFDLDWMFQPEYAYKFADIHLDYLTSWLYHPLFVAYAYNGGIGFTKRMLTRGDLFTKGKYEPFLSMELIPYEESREYGKKVLSNYVTYKRLFGEPVSIVDLFESLSSPDATDRFRSSK
jgi:soluble lytic murein transglycosylase